MNKTLLLASTAAIAIIAGCAGTTPTTTQTAPNKLNNNSATPVAFRNDKGQIQCPVMGSVIASEDKAISYQDHNGKRYYFCCDGCPDSFKKDPKKYEDGKALPKSGTM